MWPKNWSRIVTGKAGADLAVGYPLRPVDVQGPVVSGITNVRNV